ncbi:MAG: sugar phosphate isomerase/epimerase [Eubacteriaceae bacterium]|nr:sugar phosphate isomerase/epimerase [Eubacteriaceae bacterium]
MSQTGFYSWFGFAYPLEQRIEMAKNVGFDALITWFGPEFSQLDGDYREHAHIASRYGLKLENAHIPYYHTDDYWQDTLDGQAILEKNLKDLEEASLCGVGCLVFHPFGQRFPKEGGSESLFVDRLMRLGDMADKTGVRLAVENLDDNALLERILAQAGHANVGLCYDSGHAHLHAPGDYALLESLSKRLFALHMHDNSGAADEHLTPYEGTIDWKETMERIKASSYAGAFTLEAAYPVRAEGSAGEYVAPAGIGAEDYLRKMRNSCLRALAEQGA